MPSVTALAAQAEAAAAPPPAKRSARQQQRREQAGMSDATRRRLGETLNLYDVAGDGSFGQAALQAVSEGYATALAKEKHDGMNVDGLNGPGVLMARGAEAQFGRVADCDASRVAAIMAERPL